MKKKTTKKKETSKKIHPSKMTASDNGTDIMVYARRVLAAQSPTLPRTFQLKRVEDALQSQGWNFAEVRPVIEELMLDE